MTRGEIVLERIHVRWKFGYLAENDGEIDGDAQRHQVDSSICDTNEESGIDYLHCAWIIPK